MSILTRKYFFDEKEAFKKLEEIIWPHGPVCPHCKHNERIYDLKGVRTKPSKKHPEGKERFGLKKCGKCRKQFTVRVGTVFEASHVPLHIWLQATYLICSSKKGVSSHQLHRILEVTYKTAWFMSHRLREAMRDGSLDIMGGPGGMVEADETYFGYKDDKTKGKLTKRGKRGHGGQRPIVALVERNGKARTFYVETATRKNVSEIVSENVAKESTLLTDESRFYTAIGETYTEHKTVHHSSNEYVRYEKGGLEVHTNTVEGYFSLFKRGMKGIYQHCSEKHLHRYLAEFDFRYNNRIRLGVDDQARTDNALRGIVGKRLTYRWIGGAA